MAPITSGAKFMNIAVHLDADEMSNIGAGVNEGNPGEMVYWIFLRLPAIHRFCPVEHLPAQQNTSYGTSPTENLPTVCTAQIFENKFTEETAINNGSLRKRSRVNIRVFDFTSPVLPLIIYLNIHLAFPPQTQHCTGVSQMAILTLSVTSRPSRTCMIAYFLFTIGYPQPRAD
jgi:hypothetical protein